MLLFSFLSVKQTTKVSVCGITTLENQSRHIWKGGVASATLSATSDTRNISGKNSEISDEKPGNSNNQTPFF
jgi:hypothetical protein